MTTPNLNHVWPEWQIEKQIGRGTYGTVWQAVRQSSELTSRAAIKVISIPQDPYELEALRSDGLDLQASRTYLKRIVDDFVSEIRLMETFKGIQNIVSIEDYKVIEKTDVLGWDIFIRMELLTPFSAYLCDRKLTEQDVIRLGCDICTALEICAQRNIIHRDIKPENIFVNSFGSFKLGDFGTARNMESLTGGLSQKGTFNYMAPEVISGIPYDARVDVYSLGLVLYRLMNGNRLPFISEKQLLSPGERRNAFDQRVRGEALPPPCEASPELAKVILKACAFRPENRYESAAQLRRALLTLCYAAPPVPQTGAPRKQNSPKHTLRRSEKRSTDTPFMSVEAPTMAVSAPLFDTPKPKKTEKKTRRPKKAATDGPMAVNAPEMAIQAADFGTAKPRKERPWLLPVTAVLVILVLVIAGGIHIFQNGNWAVNMTVGLMPQKTQYAYGESLQTEGLMLVVEYRDGTREVIWEGFTCSPKKLNASGQQEITVRYGGVRTTFFVDVYPEPESLSIASMPKITSYTIGETLDLTGLTLELLYSDGSTELISEGFSCSPMEMTQTGTAQITVSYMDKTVTFPVTVPELTGIEVASLPRKTAYLVGDTLNTAGLTLRLLYSDGTTKIISEGFTCSHTQLAESGTVQITVTCGERTTTFPVNVAELVEIRVATPPDRTDYRVGDFLETRGLTLEALYSDGTARTIERGFTCSPTGFGRQGTMPITVTYEGKTATFDVEVEKITDVQLASPPDRTTYVVGDYLEPGGLELKILYSDGTEEIISQGFTCSPTHFTELGSIDVTVEYQNYKNTFSVEVTDGSHLENSDFRFENLLLEMGVFANEATGEGFNENGRYVQCNLCITFDLPGSLRERYQETVSCSWAEVVNGSGVREKPATFQAAKNGETLMDFGVIEPQHSTSGKEQYLICLLLPDNPYIEGTQSVTIGVGTTKTTITFDLIYAGNYETGTGWAVTNIQYE